MTDLRKVARRNRRYYLAEQAADAGKENWFRYVKTLDTYTEPVLISPEMAREMLNGFRLKRATSSDIIKAIDLSCLNSISISFSGKTMEGRLVLEAILMSRSSAIVLVTFNVSDKLNFLFS